MINLTTGPVSILPQVMQAFSATPISHRSDDFRSLYQATAQAISRQVSVTTTYIQTGSGTLANEIMIGQIALIRQPGLLLTNGEFGDRLASQATRQGLSFHTGRWPHGAIMSIPEISALISRHQPRWILCCHCETSTGIINPLDAITKLAANHGCEVFVDCMSTFAAMPLQLSGVAMATASSGKAIGAIAGLALIMCNKPPQSAPALPLYLDLLHAHSCGGIPFTLSSNLLAALATAVQCNLTAPVLRQRAHFAHQVFQLLQPLGIIPFATPFSRVFNIIPTAGNAGLLAAQLLQQGIQLSWQSSYLVKNNWLQLAVFGTCTPTETARALSILHNYFVALPSVHTSYQAAP
jgi:aspartate aminotransferase-like enzyme